MAFNPFEQRVISADEFARLSPRTRGWAVYVAGERDDQPNIPNEKNPYPAGSHEHAEWDAGQQQAYIETLDSEE